MLEILRARLASLEARAEMDKGIENPTDPEKRAMDADAKELELVSAEILKLEKADDLKDVTPENREFSELESRCSIGKIFESAVNHSASDGAEAELQSELGLKANELPLRLLREHRAVSTIPDDVGASQAPILMPVFATSVAAFMGITPVTVAKGDAVYPALTNRPTVGGPHTDSTSVSETTGAFTAEVISPARLQASFLYLRTDASRFSGMSESLRTALTEALGEALDKEVFSGTEGLFTGTNLVNNNVSAVTTYADYISNFLYSRVDGRYSNAVSELRIVMGGSTYAHSAGVYRATEADRSALDRMIADSAGVRVSAHVPAVASNKQNAVIRLGSAPDYALAVWENIALIPDEITGAKKGEIMITAVMQAATKVLRKSGFYKQQSQLA